MKFTFTMANLDSNIIVYTESIPKDPAGVLPNISNIPSNIMNDFDNIDLQNKNIGNFGLSKKDLLKEFSKITDPLINKNV